MDYSPRISNLRIFALPVLAAIGVFAFACGSTPDESPDTSRSLLTAPGLGAAKSFAVLGGSTVTNTNATKVSGDLGVNPGLAITGFPPGIVIGGSIHAGDAVALQAQTDVTAAYGVLAAQACTVDLTGKDLGGLTLKPGVYCFSSSAQLTGNLTLDAEGKADAVFVFKVVSTLITASNASVQVINGSSECGVFWQVGSSATLGTGTTFAGSILALTSISLTSGATIKGRALARNGAVTMDNNTVAIGSCAAPVVVPDAGKDAADSSVAVDASKPDSSPDAGVDSSVPDSSIDWDSGPEIDSGT